MTEQDLRYEVVSMVMIGIVGLLVYMLPSIVAAHRHHHNEWAILVLNLLLGWTVLGWVIALVWASTAVKREGG